MDTMPMSTVMKRPTTGRQRSGEHADMMAISEQTKRPICGKGKNKYIDKRISHSNKKELGRIRSVHAATVFRRALGLVDLFGGEPAIGTACQPVISGISTEGPFEISTGSDVRRAW